MHCNFSLIFCFKLNKFFLFFNYAEIHFSLSLSSVSMFLLQGGLHYFTVGTLE